MELQSPKPNHLSREDLDRLLGGEDSAEVHALLEQWRASSREGDDPLTTLAWALNATFELPPRTREDILWRASQILAASGRSTASGVQRRRREGSRARAPRWGMWFAAATFLLGLVAGGAAWKRHSLHEATSASLFYTTGNGERATITLPDGGTVALNVASRLEIPVDYMAGHHTVRLVGEGLFTVPHHEGTPLTVLAGSTATRVLGTSFVVRRYAADTATLVAVREGKVAVGATVVTAAHVVEVGRTGVPWAHLSDESPFTFATGVLTIDGLPLPAAIVELDRWYDVDIRLGDPALATRFMKGKYAAGSLRDLAEILEMTFHVHVVRTGRVLTLFPVKQ